MRQKWIRSVVGLAVLLVSALVFGGCESEDSDQSITPTHFRLQRELVSYDGTDVYYWDTTLSQARFEIGIKDFRAGDAAVRVYDDTGKELLNCVLVTPNYTIYVGDNEFVKVGQTGSGTPGRWTVQLIYNQFSGEQRINME